MSREFILNYAKGKTVKPAYLVVFCVEGESIVIHSCTVISEQNTILIETPYNNTYGNVSEKEVMRAASKYMLAKKEL